MKKTLRDCVPYEALTYLGERFQRYLDVEVSEEIHDKPWVDHHKNVHVWWKLSNGMAVAWNENPATGWSFPVASKNLVVSRST